MIEFAYAAADAVPAGNNWMSLLPMIAIFVVMWLLLIRPQQKAEKARRQMVTELKKGDRVMLASGLYGRVVQTGEHIIKMDLGKGTIVEVNPNAIAAKMNEQTEDGEKSES